jgi:hypothetical protein
VPGAKQGDQVEPAQSRHILVDDETVAERQVAGHQQLVSVRIAPDSEAIDLKREFE